MSEDKPILDEGLEEPIDSAPGAPASDPGESAEPQPTTPAPVEEIDYKSKHDEAQKHNRALNRKLVEAKRQANTKPEQPAQANEPGGRLEGDFSARMNVAEGELYRGLEKIIKLYPELDPSFITRIRENPWAFVNRASFKALNVPNALLDIEQTMADTAGALEKKTDPADAGPKPTAKQVKPSQAPIGTPEDQEDEPSDWEIPLPEIEKKVKKIKRSNIRQQIESEVNIE